MFTNKKKITKYISTRRNTQCILDGIDKAPHIASFCLTISQEIITMQIISSSPSPTPVQQNPRFLLSLSPFSEYRLSSKTSSSFLFWVVQWTYCPLDYQSYLSPKVMGKKIKIKGRKLWGWKF